MNRQPLLNAEFPDLPARNVLPVHSQWIGDLCKRGQRDFRLFLPALGKQVGDGDSQGLGQEKCFLVGDATDASLYLGQGSPGDVQALTLASGGQVFLGEVESVSQPADLFSYDV